MTEVRTTCAYCGVGCGIIASRAAERGMTIAGDPEHPANHGRLCSKGTHLGQTVGLEGRLLAPMIGQRRASWDRALDLVARKFKDAVAQHGPDSVAFYVSGQLLTEDYYVANKLMKGFIGSGRHRAGLLRGPGSGRPDRAGRVEHRLVPSGRLSADHGRACEPRHQSRRH